MTSPYGSNNHTNGSLSRKTSNRSKFPIKEFTSAKELVEEEQAQQLAAIRKKCKRRDQELSKLQERLQAAEQVARATQRMMKRPTKKITSRQIKQFIDTHLYYTQQKGQFGTRSAQARSIIQSAQLTASNEQPLSPKQFWRAVHDITRIPVLTCQIRNLERKNRKARETIKQMLNKEPLKQKMPDRKERVPKKCNNTQQSPHNPTFITKWHNRNEELRCLQRRYQIAQGLKEKIATSRRSYASLKQFFDAYAKRYQKICPTRNDAIKGFLSYLDKSQNDAFWASVTVKEFWQGIHDSYRLGTLQRQIGILKRKIEYMNQKMNF